jgi:thiamine transport system permease protein
MLDGDWSSDVCSSDLKFDFDPPRALALCLLQILMTGLTFAILRRLPEPEAERTGLRIPAFRADGRSVQARIIDVLLIGGFLIFVGSPVVAMVVAGWAPLFSGSLFSPGFGKALITSLSLALAAGLSATILTYVIARAGFSIGAGRPGSVLAWLFRLPDFVLLVPPLVIGSGWFLLMLGTGFADRLAAPVVALINAVMALPFAARLIRPELQAHLERTSQLSANLGITGLVRFRIIDWPVLRLPVLTAFSFAMALSLGDLGAIALFSTDDLVTLPSLLYARLGSYRSDDAAGLALVLGVLCILLTLPAIRLDSNAPGERS